MLRKTLTPALEATVVEALINTSSVAAAANRAGVTFGQANDIAVEHGYPDPQKLATALAALRSPALGGPTPVAAASVAPGRQLRTVDVSALLPDPDNPRDDLGDITGLAESIAQGGLLQPIVVREHAGDLVIVAGHRRLAALQLLGEQTTDVIVTRDMPPADVLAAMLIENGQRRDLDPIEEAKAFARLRAMNGWSTRDLAARVGRNQPYIDGRLALLELSVQDQELVRAGVLGVVHATAKARVTSGRVRPSTPNRVPHLSVEHPLAQRARARCLHEHQLRTHLVGKTACGECWEHVIRANERGTAVARSVQTGACVTCDQPTPALTEVVG